MCVQSRRLTATKIVLVVGAATSSHRRAKTYKGGHLLGGIKLASSGRYGGIYNHYCSVKASWSWETAHRGGTVYGGGQCSAFPNSVSRAGRLSAVF